MPRIEPRTLMTPEESFNADVWPSYQEFCDDPLNIRKAKCAAMFAHHFHEWVYIYYEHQDPIRLMGASSPKEFLLQQVNNCRELQLIWDIADAAKHRFLTRRKTARHITSSTAAFLANEEQLVIAPVNRDFAPVLEAVVMFWREWIR